MKGTIVLVLVLLIMGGFYLWKANDHQQNQNELREIQNELMLRRTGGAKIKKFGADNYLVTRDGYQKLGLETDLVVDSGGTITVVKK